MIAPTLPPTPAPLADVREAIYERRRTRLAGATDALTRMSEVVRLAESAYQVCVRWMAEDGAPLGALYDCDRASAAQRALALRRDTIARLATCRQYPLVIGDAAHHTIWLSARSIALIHQQSQTTPRILEPAQTLPPRSPLAARCGVAGRVIIFQTDALLLLAQHLAEQSLRWSRVLAVVAAPLDPTAVMVTLLRQPAERLILIPVDRPINALTETQLAPATSALALALAAAVDLVVDRASAK